MFVAVHVMSRAKMADNLVQTIHVLLAYKRRVNNARIMSVHNVSMSPGPLTCTTPPRGSQGTLKTADGPIYPCGRERDQKLAY